MMDFTQIGISFYNNSQFVFAIESFNKAIESGQDNHKTWRYLALCNAQLPNDQVLSQLHFSLEKNFNDDETHATLSGSYHALRQFDKAIEHAIISHELSPLNPTYFINVVIILHDMKKYKECLEYAEKFDREFGLHEVATYYLASALSELGQQEEAIHHMMRMYNYFGETAIITNNIGFFYSQAEMFVESIKWSRIAIELEETFAYPHNNIGFCEMKLGNPIDGLMHVNHSIELDPSNAYAYRNRALIYESMGNVEASEEDWATARMLHYDDLY